jgi:hypothetical protein
MPHYVITWEIDVEADTPQEAAIEARKMQIIPDTEALHFTVTDESKSVTKVYLSPVIDTE